MYILFTFLCSVAYHDHVGTTIARPADMVHNLLRNVKELWDLGMPAETVWTNMALRCVYKLPIGCAHFIGTLCSFSIRASLFDDLYNSAFDASKTDYKRYITKVASLPNLLHRKPIPAIRFPVQNLRPHSGMLFIYLY